MTEPIPASPQAVRQVAEWLLEAQSVVALTGAGLSTHSGIPDFRSAGSGLWTKYLPMEVASLTTFRHRPELFFEWLHPLASHMWSAIPNVAHLALAELEKLGHLHTIITQNIDGLHHRAGSKHVLEVHGTLNSLTCVSCYQRQPAELFLPAYLERGQIPYCPECGRTLKPDIILFEEQLPVLIWQQAERASRTCNLMIVAGTSLEVMPSARLPLNAVEAGARLVIINQGETFLDVRADLVLRGDVAEIIPQIAAEVSVGQTQ